MLAALDRDDRYRSAQQLHTELIPAPSNDRGVRRRIGLSTVYRILHDLAADEIIGTHTSETGEILYRRRKIPGHHHLVCRICGRAIEIEAPEIETWIARTARAHRFTAPTNTIHIDGTCPACTRRRAGVPG